MPDPDLLESALGLRDLIEANADATEAECTMAKPVVDAIDEAGLFRLSIPIELGGLEADVETASTTTSLTPTTTACATTSSISTRTASTIHAAPTPREWAPASKAVGRARAPAMKPISSTTMETVSVTTPGRALVDREWA